MHMSTACRMAFTPPRSSSAAGRAGGNKTVPPGYWVWTAALFASLIAGADAASWFFRPASASLHGMQQGHAQARGALLTIGVFQLSAAASAAAGTTLTETAGGWRAPAAAATQWFFRKAAPAAGADGRSYATAWPTQSGIQWSLIRPGDTLFLCGLSSRGLDIPTGFGGAEGAHVTIDGNCPTGVTQNLDPGLWVGGNPLDFPAGWHGPDAHGIFSLPYGGSSDMAVEASSNSSTDPRSLTRIKGAGVLCNSSVPGPNDPTSWAPGTMCDWKPRTTDGGGGMLFYKPAFPATAAKLYVGWTAPFLLSNLSHVTIKNLRLYGVAYALILISGGTDLVIRDSHIQWAGSFGIEVTHAHALPPFNMTDGELPTGLRGGLIENNTIHQCGTGVYFVAMHTAGASNHVTLRGNRFLDIDTENFYHNGDCHAIGVQGGSHNLFERNTIDGAGGSGITFYQGPDNKDGQPPQEMHDNTVRYNTIANVVNLDQANQHKNQHGIETGGSRYVQGNLSYNNSVYYNILVNVTSIALRSKTLVPGAGHGTYQWRYLNNVVVNAGVGFSTAYECLGPEDEPVCYHPEQVANNVFLNSRLAHHDGWDNPARFKNGTPVRPFSHLHNDWQHNAFYPDGPAMFCYGLCAWPGQAPCANCTNFATFEKDQPHPTHSLLTDPQLTNAFSVPQGFRPKAGSPLLGAGLDVGLTADFGGVPVPPGSPTIGVFQGAAASAAAGTALETVGGHRQRAPGATAKRRRRRQRDALSSPAASLRVLDLQPVNPNFFGYNVEALIPGHPDLPITYNDTSAVALADALRLGVLRYPGGILANIWDPQAGRYIAPPAPIQKSYVPYLQDYAPALNRLPRGTFSAASFVAGVGGKPRAVLWSLNVFTLNVSEACEQIRYISRLPGQQVPGVLLELGNELYPGTDQGIPRFPNATAYVEVVRPIVACARKLMPLAKVGACGWTGDGRAQYERWNRDLRPHAHLFDGISQHDYLPAHRDIAPIPEEERVTFVAGYSRALVRDQVAVMRSQVGRNLSMWQTEFGFGLDNQSQCVMRKYIFGALHGAFHASRIFEAINAPGSLGAVTMETFVFPNPNNIPQPNRTDDWCGMPAGSLTPTPNRPDLARVSGTGQLVSHLAARALASSGMHAVQVEHGPLTTISILGEQQPCLQAAAFSHNGTVTTMALLNICNHSTSYSLRGMASIAASGEVSATTYSLLDTGEAGGWAPLPEKPGAFPWSSGPLRPQVRRRRLAADGTGLDAEPLSFAILELPRL